MARERTLRLVNPLLIGYQIPSTWVSVVRKMPCPSVEKNTVLSHGKDGDTAIAVVFIPKVAMGDSRFTPASTKLGYVKD